MTLQMRYGAHGRLTVEWPSSMEVVDHSSLPTGPLDDPTEAALEALARPLDHPPLADSVVAGDRIVVVVEPGTPRAAEITAAVMRTLVEAGHAPEALTLLWAPADGADAPPSGRIDARYAAQISVVRHDPDDSPSLAYLAALKDAEPVYLNRAICDADFVLPIGVARPSRSLGYLGRFGGVYPAFSNRETQVRLRPAIGKGRAVRQRRMVDAADQVAWLTGAQFAVQVVPGSGAEVQAVLAGLDTSVSRATRQACDELWRHELAAPVAMVVVGLGGDPGQQTWNNAARALLPALKAVADQGTIVLATELSERPGPALRRCGRWQEDEPLPSRRKLDREPDAVPARMLLAARQRARVYLLSKLPRRTAESLGVICIDEPADVQRLGSRHSSCLLLGDAQFAAVTLKSLEPTS